MSFKIEIIYLLNNKLINKYNNKSNKDKKLKKKFLK